VAPEPYARDRPEQHRARHGEIDVAGHEVGDRSRPQQDRGVEDVGPHHSRRHQLEEQDEPDGDERPASGGREPEHEAHEGAHRDGRGLVAARELEALALAGHELLHEQRPGERGEPRQEEDPREDLQQQIVEGAFMCALERLEHVHASDGSRDGPDRDPTRQRKIHGALTEVLEAAHGLRDGPVGEVRAHGHHGLHPEDEDEQRGHQRASADPRHPDEEPDHETEEDEGRVHVATRNRVVAAGRRSAPRTPR
jgi:hypothetical protein